MRFGDALQLIAVERERRAREQGRSAAELETVRQQARDGDPLPYVRLQWPTLRIEPWQLDALTCLFDPSIRIIAIKGNTGCGKNVVGGIGCCAFFDVWPNSKARISRDTYDTAVSEAFGEVAKWWKRMSYKPAGALLTTGIDGGPEHWLQVANPRADEGFHGVHAPHVLYWLDEATAPNLANRYDAVMTQAHKLLATANPRTMSGWYRGLFPKANPDVTQTVTTHHGIARCLTISAHDCTNVREKRLAKPVGPIGGIEIAGRRFDHGEPIPPELYRHVEPIIPGQTCYDEAQVFLTHPDPFQRDVMGLGRFPKSDPVTQVVAPDWLDPCCQRHTRWTQAVERSRTHPTVKLTLSRILPVEAFGLDVAASAHGDKTVLVAGGGRGIRAIATCQFADTTQTVAWVIETALHAFGVDLARGEHPVGIDWGGGYGNAVGDPLRTRGVHVVEIRGSAPSETDPQRYGNLRAELYGEFAARVNPQGQFAESPFFLPDDAELKEELVAPQKIFAGADGQKFFITPKDRRGGAENYRGQTLKEMLGRSPDKADGAVYMLYALRRKGLSVRAALDSGFF